MSKRKIITIDEGKCNGCALCLPNCPEGAIQIIDQKARLISDLFCDGLGACLGHCPQRRCPGPAGDLHRQPGQRVSGLELGDPEHGQHVAGAFRQQFHQRDLGGLDGAFVPAFGFQHRSLREFLLLGQD